MKALVVVEHSAGKVDESSLGLLSKAATLGAARGVAFGKEAEEAAREAARFGAEVVYAVGGPAFDAPLPGARIAALAQLADDWGAGAILLSTTVLAAEVAARLAARLAAGVNWDLVDLDLDEGRLVGVQGALEDSVRVRCGWTSPVSVALVRPGSFTAVEAPSSSQVEQFTPANESAQDGAVLVEQRADDASSSIESAEVIVAGGRGLGDPAAFALLEELAGLLGGAVAATRPVVDAGWYPHSSQVGQTGKTVAPKLYLACGISGSVQHKVGMIGAHTVVAINSDPDAPIFGYSDIAVVADLHLVIPRMIELLRERLSETPRCP